MSHRAHRNARRHPIRPSRLRIPPRLSLSLPQNLLHIPTIRNLHSRDNSLVTIILRRIRNNILSPNIGTITNLLIIRRTSPSQGRKIRSPRPRIKNQVIRNTRRRLLNRNPNYLRHPYRLKIIRRPSLNLLNARLRVNIRTRIIQRLR